MSGSRRCGAIALLALGALSGAAAAAELEIAAGDTGDALALLREHLDRFEQETGHAVEIVPMPSSTTDQLAQHRIWLADESPRVDVLFIDVIWSGLLAGHLLGLPPERWIGLDFGCGQVTRIDVESWGTVLKWFNR